MKSRDVADIIDSRPISALQWQIFLLCGLVNLLDGADSQSIGVAGPLIAAELHVPMSLFSTAFSAGLLGAVIGALSFGSLADRFGRKRMLVVATLTLAIFTLLTAAVSSFPMVLAVRFLAGLGLGGATPCFITLTAEYAPSRSRAVISTVMWSAYPLGASLGGVLNAYAIPALGWRSVFYIGSVLPLVTVTLLLLLLPESLAFLTLRGKRPATIAAIVRRIDPGIAASGVTFTARTDRVAGGALSNLFTEGRAASTLLLWGMFFTAFGSTTIAVLLMPTLFRLSGFSLSAGALLVGLFNLVSVASMAAAGQVVARFGAMALAVAFVCGAAVMTGLGHAASSLPAAVALMALLGLTVSLAASGGIALAALAYPAAIRSTGVGWAMGMGRLGQVLSPLLVGRMLGWEWNVSAILTTISIIPVLGGIFCLTRTVLTWRSETKTIRETIQNEAREV
jgi:AAHS family 4-hydroxybenzoate transporter-like MFS transporter